jgi:hypothetical protein
MVLMWIYTSLCPLFFLYIMGSTWQLIDQDFIAFTYHEDNKNYHNNQGSEFHKRAEMECCLWYNNTYSQKWQLENIHRQQVIINRIVKLFI